eukprot:gene58429-77955_t
MRKLLSGFGRELWPCAAGKRTGRAPRRHADPHACRLMSGLRISRQRVAPPGVGMRALLPPGIRPPRGPPRGDFLAPLVHAPGRLNFYSACTRCTAVRLTQTTPRSSYMKSSQNAPTRPARLLAMLALATLATLARAEPVPGQGTWQSTLSARDLDGDGK